MSKQTLTAPEAAEHLGISIATLRRWADAGKLPYWRTPGGQRRFDRDELDEWRENQREGAQG